MSIVLLHVLLVVALVRSAQAPDARQAEQPADYIAFAFIAAPTPPVVVEMSASPPVTAPSVRPQPAIVAREAMPQPEPMGIVQDSPPSADTPPLAPEGRLDMASLRAAARQVDSERALEARRESQQLRGMEDTALSRAVERATVPDCQTKYAGGEKANILLLVPLAIDTLTGKGCNW